MSSSAPNKSKVARAAAILTNGEVAALDLDLNDAWGARVNVQLDFTLGSLTNVIVKHYVSMDGTNYYVISSGTAAQTETITATAVRGITIPDLVGWKFYRTSLTGTGTLTSSSATLTYRYLRRGSQG